MSTDITFYRRYTNKVLKEILSIIVVIKAIKINITGLLKVESI